MAQSPATELDRITIHLPAAVPVAEHGRWLRRATNALAGADLTPPGFPPGAILVVRRLADPVPGALWRGEPWQAGDRWGQQARDALARHWRRAARPVLGAVPAAAEAVWFADRAEWLACLSRDLAVGERRWWWEHWQKYARPPGEHLASLWREEARWLPAACALLQAHSAGLAVACANSIPPSRLAAVRAALIAEHALSATWQTATVPAEHIAAHLPTILPPSGGPPGGSEGAQIVALALVIHQRPAIARAGPQAAHALAAPAAGEDQLRGVVDTEPAATVPRIDAMSPFPRPVATPPHGDGAAVSDQAVADSPEAPPVVAPRHLPSQHHPVPQPDRAAPSAGQGDALEVRSLLAGGPGEARDTTAPRSPEALTDRAEDAALPTALGGVWYLLNVLEALGWLDDIPPAADPWLKFAAVARLALWQAEAEGAMPGEASLSYDLPAAVEADPIWSLLAGQARPEGDLAVAEAAANAWARVAWPTIRGWLEQRLSSQGTPLSFLALPARIALSRTHIAVRFRLDQIDLALRMAGLDRDPGWLPRLRRVVQFIFA